MNIDKLKEHQKVVDEILTKNDSSYKAQKEAETKSKLNAEELSKKMDTLLTTKTETQNTLGSALMDKLMSTFIKEFDPFTISQSISSLTPVITELKAAITQLKVPQLTSKELGTDKILNSVTSLEQSLKKGSHEVDLAEIVTKLEDVKSGINQLVKKEVVMPEFPKTISLPALTGLENKLDKLITTMQVVSKTLAEKKENDDTKVIAAITDLGTSLKSLEQPKIEFPDTISVDNFPPQKIPQPVTNINLNPLRGFVKTTAQTVSTTLATLPGYGVLNNRRSVLIYNADTATTLYIGGSDVTTSNGMPVPPLSYSPILDAGVKLIVYGVAASSINVRVMEISNDAIGG